MITVDARGLECPKPVLMAKKEMDGGAAELTVLVDNPTAEGNLLRLAESEGFTASSKEEGGIYTVEMKKTGEAAKSAAALPVSGKWVFFAGTNSVGTGSDELGGNLMKMMLFTLSESENLPEYVLLMNSGVKLACGDTPTVEHLVNLEKKGVKVLVCGTCLNYYEIAETLKVGTVSNMYDILSKMQDAGKVISLG